MTNVFALNLIIESKGKLLKKDGCLGNL